MPFDANMLDFDAPFARRTQKSETSENFYRALGKRAMDIFLILLCLPIVLPIVAGLALLVSRDGHNPFYTQLRVGRNGKTFRLFKLRTMVPDADKQLARYLADNPRARAEWDADQKLKNDPRVIALGGFLRKTSLDELPQLFNVLRGEMSLVGPRPMMVEQKDMYDGVGYYDLRPGLTGLWQISDRNNCGFRDRAKFDDVYNHIASFSIDVAIILRTFRVVVRGTGY